MGVGLVNLDVGNTLKGIGGLARDLRAAFTGDIDPAKKAEIETRILEIESQAALGQIAINKEEAKNPSLFVSGWRPFIGWVCGFALLYHYILDRLIEWGVALSDSTVTAPTFDLGDLILILGGLLGLGGLRTFERYKGVARK
jgi:hypothetical protein